MNGPSEYLMERYGTRPIFEKNASNSSMGTGARLAHEAMMSRRMEQQEQLMQAKAMNQQFLELLANRGEQVNAPMRHSNMPMIIHNSQHGDSDLPLVTGGQIPLGFNDQGMVRLASAIGEDFAQSLFKEGAVGVVPSLGRSLSGGAFRNLGKDIAGGVSRVGSTISSGAKRVGSTISSGVSRVGDAYTRAGQAVGSKLQGAKQVVTGKLQDASQFVKDKAQQGKDYLNNQAISASVRAEPVTNKLMGVNAAERASKFNTAAENTSYAKRMKDTGQSKGMVPNYGAKAQPIPTTGQVQPPSGAQAPTQTQQPQVIPANPQPVQPQSTGTVQPVGAPKTEPQQLSMGFDKPQAAGATAPATPQQPSNPAPAGGGAPTPPQGAAAESAAPNTGTIGSPEQPAAGGKTWWDKLHPQITGGNIARIGAMGAGIYGLYKGVQGVGKLLSQEPPPATYGEGATMPAQTPNQYGQAI